MRSDQARLDWPGRSPAKARGGNPRKHRDTGARLAVGSSYGHPPEHGNLVIQSAWQDAVEAILNTRDVPGALGQGLAGDIKCVYADPPFRTGRDFGHYRDDEDIAPWLDQIADLARCARSLLRPDGSFWLHLSEQHAHHAQVICDEVFGPRHKVGQIVWQRSYAARAGTGQITSNHDHILVYRRSSAFRPNGLPRPPAGDSLYASADGDPRPWRRDNLTAPGASSHPGLVYAIQSPITGEVFYPRPGTHWRWEPERMMRELAAWGVGFALVADVGRAERERLVGQPVPPQVGVLLTDPLEVARRKAQSLQDTGPWPIVFFGTTGQHRPQRKTYLTDVVHPGSWWTFEDAGSTDEATEHIKSMFGPHQPFATPKPERLMQRILTIATRPGETVFDPFAGSGTTAAVAHKMGRAWVTSEIEQPTVERFVVPRLQAVVDGNDPGGVTELVGQRPSAGLPAGISTADTLAFNRVLNTITRADAGALDAATVRKLRAATRLEKIRQPQWTGGGGFRTAVVTRP